MQQIGEYRLNLVEGGDRLSMTPINENFTKLSAFLSGGANMYLWTDPQGSYVTTLSADAYAGAEGYALLGRVGGGARMALVSYTGTGTWGEGSPCSVTFPFPPTLLVMLRCRSEGAAAGLLPAGSVSCGLILTHRLTESYVQGSGFDSSGLAVNSLGRLSADGLTFSWYSTVDADRQCNGAGEEYAVAALAF